MVKGSTEYSPGRNGGVGVSTVPSGRDARHDIPRDIALRAAETAKVEGVAMVKRSAKIYRDGGLSSSAAALDLMAHHLDLFLLPEVALRS